MLIIGEPDGQGSRRPPDPSPQPAPPRPVRRGGLCDPDRVAHRVGALRPRARRVHWRIKDRRAASRWPMAARSSWTMSMTCPGRAGEAASRCSGARRRTGRRHPPCSGGCAHHHRSKRSLRAGRGGQVSRDLFYRLNVLPIRLPPLRERREDIPALIDHFMGRYFRQSARALALSETVRQLFQQYPGRETCASSKNACERLAQTCTCDQRRRVHAGQHSPSTPRPIVPARR